MSGSHTNDPPIVLTPLAAAGLFSLMDRPAPPIVMARLSDVGADLTSPTFAHMRGDLATAGLIDDSSNLADLTPAAAEMLVVVTQATTVITIEEAPGMDPLTAFLLQDWTVVLGADGDSVTLRMLHGDDERKRWLVTALGRALPCKDGWPFCLDTTSDCLGQALQAAMAGESEAFVEWQSLLGGSSVLVDGLAAAATAFPRWGAITAIDTRNGDVSTTRVGLSVNGAWLARVCLQDEEYHTQLAWLPAAAVLDVLSGTWTIRLRA